ncbi:hypothetical protein [Bradyrhizobium sp. STM 3557]|uniref:hypothetical protein n=1 Tax=Bradyrhizobium sp. STM 3557 TaxID=578920 RepID=UPI00388F901D
MALHLGAVRTIQAFKAQAVTQKDSLRTNFETTRFPADRWRDARFRRSLPALVPQDLVILSGSIAENIRFVRPEPSLEQVRRPRPKGRLIASQRADAPEEYNTARLARSDL